MELRQLECLLACHENGTFTAAARSLNLVQSAVSSSVAKLERELGVRLFDRTTTTLRLTAAGAAAIGPARDALAARERVRDAVDATRGELRGTVRIGAMNSVHGFDFAGALARVHRLHPGITVTMRQHPRGTAGNVDDLRAGTSDLALGAFLTAPPGTVLTPLLEEPLLLAVAPDHRLAGAATFAVAELAGERFIDFPPGWGSRAVVDDAVPDRHQVIEVADQFFALQLAASGFGVTLVPRSVAAGVPGTVALPCRDRPLPFRMAVAHRADRTPTNAARAVIDAMVAATRR